VCCRGVLPWCVAVVCCRGVLQQCVAEACWRTESRLPNSWSSVRVLVVLQWCIAVVCCHGVLQCCGATVLCSSVLQQLVAGKEADCPIAGRLCKCVRANMLRWCVAVVRCSSVLQQRVDAACCKKRQHIAK